MTPPTPTWTVAVTAGEIALSNGVRHAYVGNVHDAAYDSTYCHACGELLIGCDWYVLSQWNLSVDARCPNCSEPCAGVFEPTPGDWGARRQPVRLVNFR